MLARVASVLDPAPSELALAEARVLDRDITRRRKEHFKTCASKGTCFFHVRIREEVRVAIVIRKAMRNIDDYEYDLQKMHIDLQPIADVTFKVFCKAQSVLNTYWACSSLPCMAASAAPGAKWEVSENSLQDAVRRLAKQGSEGLAPPVVAALDEALAELWERGGMPCAKPWTMAAVVVCFAYYKAGAALDVDDIARRFKITTETVHRCLKRIA